MLDRVRAAELASTIADADPERRVTDKVSQQLLDQAGVVIVALQVDGARRPGAALRAARPEDQDALSRSTCVARTRARGWPPRSSR